MENRIVTPLRIAFIGLAMLSVFGNLFVPYILQKFNLDEGIQFITWDFKVVLSGFLTGLLIGEFVALGFWLLLDTMSVSYKLVAGLSLGLLLAASLIGGMQDWGMPTSAGIFIIVLGGLMPWAFLGTIFCLGRLTDPGLLQSKNRSHATERSRQFGIGYLMFLMVIVAVLLSIIRYIMPWNRGEWLDHWEFIGLGFWSVWLVVGTSVVAWFSFAAVVSPSFFHVGMSLGLAVVGPSIFQWIASFFIDGKFSIKNPQWFEALPQSISFGVLAASLLLGVIVRKFYVTSHAQVDDEKVPIGTVEP